MTTKEYLMQYINAKKRLKAISEEMILIRSEAMKITPVISDMPSGSSHINDKIGRAIEQLDICAEKLSKEAEIMNQSMGNVKAAIYSVQDKTLRRLLELRYINGYTWEQIAVEMNYSYVHICRLHGAALNKIML